MPQTKKIATCCYCGTRAVLVLDTSRHELACSACGAPLHDMKSIPAPAEKSVYRPAPVADTPKKRAYHPHPKHYSGYKKRKKRKRKPLGRKIFEEIWDVVEDIFD